MPQSFTESSYFSQMLKAYLGDINFPRRSPLLQYVSDLLLSSPFQTSSQEDSIQLLKLKSQPQRDTKLPRKNAVLNTQSLSCDIRTRATPRCKWASWCPKFLHTQKPSANCKVFFSGQFVTAEIRFKISLMTKLLYVLLKSNNLDPILCEESNNIAFKRP